MGHAHTFVVPTIRYYHIVYDIINLDIHSTGPEKAILQAKARVHTTKC